MKGRLSDQSIKIQEEGKTIGEVHKGKASRSVDDGSNSRATNKPGRSLVSFITLHFCRSFPANISPFFVVTGYPFTISAQLSFYANPILGLSALIILILLTRTANKQSGPAPIPGQQ